MKRLLNIVLFVSFFVTIMAPLTGVHIHKLSSTLFILLSIVHVIVYRKKMSRRRWLLMATILLSFSTGLFGMILEQFQILQILHRVISIVLVFFLAIHIFVFHRKY